MQKNGAVDEIKYIKIKCCIMSPPTLKIFENNELYAIFMKLLGGEGGLEHLTLKTLISNNAG
jgi:hypothetical protein